MSVSLAGAAFVTLFTWLGKPAVIEAKETGTGTGTGTGMPNSTEPRDRPRQEAVTPIKRSGGTGTAAESGLGQPNYKIRDPRQKRIAGREANLAT
jgi:hypothetical protein